jgi:hypothetical protein
MSKGDVSEEEYALYFAEQLEKINDANSAALAEYVVHRRIIIDLLEKNIQQETNGKYSLEKYLHGLFYPMRSTSDEVDYEAHNLWLIDENLSYCKYISSDVSLNSVSKDRPDLLVLDEFFEKPIAISESENDGSAFDTVTIFELKRPMRDNYTESENPIVQLYGYVQKLRSNEMKDRTGRLINIEPSTKFYLYAICDITKTLKPIIESRGFHKSPDGLGYYGFNENYNAYFEILSYNKVLKDAKQRNRVLFDKLGIAR